jgi:methylthioribose-1-phosphate isomerase
MGDTSSGTLFAAAAIVSAVGTVASVQSQRGALARENYRIETEKRMAKVQALEEENARKRALNETIANNLAWQSISGYSDESRSFLNINNEASNIANKDIANIRLMGKNIQNKYSSMLFENKYKERDLVFGGYVSAISELTTGYAQYDYYKEPKKKIT